MFLIFMKFKGFTLVKGAQVLHKKFISPVLAHCPYFLELLKHNETKLY